MAMIECPECGRKISSFAPACPDCFIPMEAIQKILSRQALQQADSIKKEVRETPEPEKQDVSAKSASTVHTDTKATKTRVAETVLQWEKPIHCAICKNIYESKDIVCPKCKYPVLSLSQNTENYKQNFKIYRKENGVSSSEHDIGEIFKMGRFQGEEISWRVLAVADGKELVISEKGLDARPFNDFREAVSWEICTLRKWLNNEFYYGAFNHDEKKKIMKRRVTADQNPQFSTNPGRVTEDQVFLLSIQEAERYFADGNDRMAYPSEYARNKGAYINDSTKCCWWWLRSPGRTALNAANDYGNGWVTYNGNYVDSGYICVRPVMWVKQEV